MNERAETGSTSARPSDRDHLELISCEGCGRSFATPDGPGMIASIKGPCPDCGGRFALEVRKTPGSGPAAR